MDEERDWSDFPPGHVGPLESTAQPSGSKDREKV